MHITLPLWCNVRAPTGEGRPHLGTLDERHLALPVNLAGALLGPCSRTVHHYAAAEQGGWYASDIGQVTL